MSETSALEREAGETLPRFAIAAAIYASMALGCAFGVRHAYTMQQSGDIRVAEGRVVALEPLAGENRLMLITEFVDDAGTRRTTRDSASLAPDARVGDRVPVIHSAGDARFARIINSGERWLRALFLGFTFGLLALTALLAVLGLRQRARRRWLLRHGRVEPGQAVQVEWRNVPIAGAPPAWRVRASWLEPHSVTWREVRSAWQDSRRWQPAVTGAPVAIHVDPRDPRRAWLPATPLRAPAAV